MADRYSLFAFRTLPTERRFRPIAEVRKGKGPRLE